MTSAQQLCWNKYLFSGSGMCWKFQQSYEARQDTPTPGSRSFCLGDKEVPPRSEANITHWRLCADKEPERVVWSLSSYILQSHQRDDKYIYRKVLDGHTVDTRWKDPQRAASVLTLKWGVEFGRAERTFQVEKSILSKCRRFTKRKITSLVPWGSE